MSPTISELENKIKELEMTNANLEGQICILEKLLQIELGKRLQYYPYPYVYPQQLSLQPVYISDINNQLHRDY